MRVSLPNNSNTVKAAYIYRDACKSKANDDGSYECVAYGSYGFMFDSISLATITNKNSHEQENKTLVHEFSHFYGTRDHHNINGSASTQDLIEETGNEGYNRYCIHGEEKDNEFVVNNLIICDGCKSEIMKNRNKYS